MSCMKVFRYIIFIDVHVYRGIIETRTQSRQFVPIRPMIPYTPTALVLLAKYPEPRSVKTRLVNGTAENGYAGLKDIPDASGRAIGQDEAHRLAAGMYRAFLVDRFEAHRGRDYDVLLATSQPEYADAFRSITGRDVSYHVVSGANMGEMMYGIFAGLLPRYPYVLISGSDMPSLDEAVIERVRASLSSHDIVLVPAQDGAYNLIGMRKPHRIFDISRWSSGSELEETVALLRQRNITHEVLDEYQLLDIDTIEDLVQLMRSPGTDNAPETNAFLTALGERLDLAD